MQIKFTPSKYCQSWAFLISELRFEYFLQADWNKFFIFQRVNVFKPK